MILDWPPTVESLIEKDHMELEEKQLKQKHQQI